MAKKWIAHILPDEAVEALTNVVATVPPEHRAKRLDEVTEAIKERYPSYFRKGAKSAH